MRDFLVSVLGPLFGIIFDFYQAHAVLFNSIVIAYGFVIVLAWSNLVRIRLKLVDALVDQMRQSPEKYAKADPEKVLEDVKIPWEDVVNAARFPLVARQTALYPRRKSIEAVQALLPADALLKESLEVLERRSQPARKADKGP